MATIKSFEELEIWQKARLFCNEVFRVTRSEPFASNYSLKDQIRRSSGSMMDNVAEGFERGGRKEFIQFLAIAKGSEGEARSQLYRAKDYGYLTESEFKDLMQLVTAFSSQTQHLLEYLKRSEHKGTRYKVEERLLGWNGPHEIDLPF